MGTTAAAGILGISTKALGKLVETYGYARELESVLPDPDAAISWAREIASLSPRYREPHILDAVEVKIHDKLMANSKDVRALRQIVPNPNAFENFQEAGSSIEEALALVAGARDPVRATRRHAMAGGGPYGAGLASDVHAFVASLSTYPWTELAQARSGPALKRAVEDAQHDLTPLKAAVVGGLLAPISEEHVNVVNVDIVARRRGMQITEKRGPAHEIYSNLITVRLSTSAGETRVSGTLAHDGPHILLIDDFWVDVPPSEGYLLACENRDRPGMIGALGTLLGQFDVNISFMNVGRHAKRGMALMVLTVDEPLTPEQLAQVRQIPDIYSAKLARL